MSTDKRQLQSSLLHMLLSKGKKQGGEFTLWKISSLFSDISNFIRNQLKQKCINACLLICMWYTAVTQSQTAWGKACPTPYSQASSCRDLQPKIWAVTKNLLSYQLVWSQSYIRSAKKLFNPGFWFSVWIERRLLRSPAPPAGWRSCVSSSQPTVWGNGSFFCPFSSFLFLHGVSHSLWRSTLVTYHLCHPSAQNGLAFLLHHFHRIQRNSKDTPLPPALSAILLLI